MADANIAAVDFNKMMSK